MGSLGCTLNNSAHLGDVRNNSMASDLAVEKPIAMAMPVPEGCLGSIRAVQGCGRLSNEVHLLPCCVSYDGPAPVSNYFLPNNTGDCTGGVQTKQATFRGRRLLGCTMELPHDYCGFVLEKEISGKCSDIKKECSVDKPDIWNATATFQDITYWNHDQCPSSTDSVPRAFQWLHVASMMHRPVSPAEVTMMEQDVMFKGKNVRPKRKCSQR
eukprot:c24532_g1_i1 orf=465-1097(-)